MCRTPPRLEQRFTLPSLEGSPNIRIDASSEAARSRAPLSDRLGRQSSQWRSQARSQPARANLAARATTSHCMSRVLAAPDHASNSDVRCLRGLAFTTDFAPFASAYESAESGRRNALANVYSEITGRDLERDSIRLAD